MEFTDSLRDDVKKISMEMHELFQRGYTPKVRYTKQCKACSLENLCVPKLQKAGSVKEYMERNVRE